jgi:rhodanese-related sulfurtransferase
VRCLHPYNAAVVDDIKRAAAARGRKMGLRYAGALLPAEAHALMSAGAKLVDVRTQPELVYVGKVPRSVTVEWQTYPCNRPNPEFLAELAASVSKDEPVMFLCRSGARSHAAADAATQAGWRECYNVLEGFEGDKDAAQHRNAVGGWRKAGLPWTQS